MARRIGSIRGRIGGALTTIDTGPVPGENAITGTGSRRIERSTALNGNLSNLVRGTVSFWIYQVAAGTTDIMFDIEGSTNQISRVTSSAFNANWENGIASIDVIQQSDTDIAPQDQWAHMFHTWDKPTGTGYMAINGRVLVPGELATDTIASSAVVNFTLTAARSFNLTSGGAAYGLWLSATEFLDPTTTSILDSFINSVYEPVALGADGSNPTNNQPLIYLDDPRATILNNRGSGGDFDTVVGTLTDSPHKPISPARYAHDNQGTAGLGALNTVLGVGDTQQISLSCWFVPIDTSGTLISMYDGATFFMDVGFDTSDRITYTFRNSGGTTILAGTSTTDGSFLSSTWNHVLLSVNMQAATGADAIRIFQNNVDVTQAPTTFVASGSIGSGTSGATLYLGDDGVNSTDFWWSQWWMDFDTFLDFSVAATRALFVATAVQPVSLGSSGDTPTGTAPVVYQDFPTFLGNSPIEYPFLVNRGTGGDFTQSGTHITPTSNPASALL